MWSPCAGGTCTATGSVVSRVDIWCVRDGEAAARVDIWCVRDGEAAARVDIWCVRGGEAAARPSRSPRPPPRIFEMRETFGERFGRKCVRGGCCRRERGA